MNQGLFDQEMKEELREMAKLGMAKLADGDLEGVIGGFRETNGSLASSPSSFSNQVLKDTKTNSVEYRCNCGKSFICYDGYVVGKSSWIELCNKKNYSYPFA